MRQLILKFVADEQGATSIEYAVIAAGVCIAIIAAVNSIGPTLNTKYTDLNTSLK